MCALLPVQYFVIYNKRHKNPCLFRGKALPIFSSSTVHCQEAPGMGNTGHNLLHWPISVYKTFADLRFLP